MAADPPITRSIVAIRMEEIREARHISMVDLARKLNTTRMRIWRLENGHTDICVDDAARIAEALGVTVAALYRESKAS